MKSIRYRSRGAVLQGALVGSVIIAFLSIASFLLVPFSVEPLADMRIEPARGGVTIGDTFVVEILVSAQTPVNVFKGEIHFDHAALAVDSIDYNVSIADLWAELPWYENGEGTVNFTGGSTRKGGFLGTGSLMTITFRALSKGETVLHLVDARILEHNGLGTDAPLVEPIDAFFTVEESIITAQTIATPQVTTVRLTVTPQRPSTDLNGDGKQSITDVSIFMLNIFGDNLRFDFNQDGFIDTKDLSILMSAT